MADVANFGGYAKQFTLLLEPFQLERFGLTFDDVVKAVTTNNANAGGSVLRRGEMSFVIRGKGAFQTMGDIESTVVNTIDGTPVYVRDVATVRLDSMLPTGIFSKDYRGRVGRRNRAVASRRKSFAGARPRKG